MANDPGAFTGNPWQGFRYLFIARTPDQALHGSIAELLLKPAGMPVDTLALLTSLYHGYQQPSLAIPTHAAGIFLLYSAGYHYLNGRRFSDGALLPGQVKLWFQGVEVSTAKASTAATDKQKRASTNKVNSCMFYYNAITGEYLGSSAGCGLSDDSGGYNSGDGSPTGPGDYGGTPGNGGNSPNDPGSGPQGPPNSPTNSLAVINNLTPCLTQSYNSLKGAILLYSSQTSINGTNSVFLPITYFNSLTDNWQLNVGTLPPGWLGSTISSYPNNTVTTTFDAQQLQNATDLSVMATMMHESVHAYLVAYYSNDPTKFGMEYPDLIDAFIYQSPSGQNNTQHNQIVTSFKNDIGQVLYIYGTQLGYNVSLQYCQDLAWNGLGRTSAYQALSQQEKTRIAAAINQELGGVNALGLKPSGC
ncbi:hypothetical protein [Hymenobacter baengnokdamensis]|uniref:hypothetical protein n=1 Tax=Hymenobacter baengnokdamensis TaxID=2615203 RepID=UPI0017863F61|nr:hypothetical protein [Hymenobacter baengnokdamensis]